jgi:hypothetical protein
VRVAVISPCHAIRVSNAHARAAYSMKFRRDEAGSLRLIGCASLVQKLQELGYKNVWALFRADSKHGRMLDCQLSQNDGQPSGRTSVSFYLARNREAACGRSTVAAIPIARSNSIAGTPSGSSRMTGPTGAKAREALWAAICFNMSVAD